MWWHVVDQEFQRETKEMGTDKNGFILILPSKGIKRLEQLCRDVQDITDFVWISSHLAGECPNPWLKSVFQFASALLRETLLSHT